MLDRQFDADNLHSLRAAVLAYATRISLPQDQAIDVLLAMHELAANAVRHGAGSGRLRMRATAGTLHCQVSDAGPARETGPWPFRRGHGLWLVRKVAARLTVISGPGGSVVTAVFDLPATAGKLSPRPAARSPAP